MPEIAAEDPESFREQGGCLHRREGLYNIITSSKRRMR
jgi:hypothetical protein